MMDSDYVSVADLALAYVEATHSLKVLIDAHDKAMGEAVHNCRCRCRLCVVHEKLWREACIRERAARTAAVDAWLAFVASQGAVG